MRGKNPGGKDFGYEENLVKTAERLLKDLSAVEAFTKTEEFSLEEDVADEIRREEFSVIDGQAEAIKDGYVEIRLSEDLMTCFADFHAPTPDGNPISADFIQQKLMNLGVVYGVDWDKIGKTIFTSNTERVDILDVVIARGKLPVDEVPAHFLLHERFLKTSVDSEDKANVDYKSHSPYILVKKGDYLACLVPKVEGSLGSDIKGRKIPYGLKNLRGVVGKKNTEAVQNGIVAAAEGIAKTDNQEVWVEEILYINGNVDYRTGHINFPGAVFIEGQVADDFHVYCGGSLYCKKTLNATDVRAKGELTVKGGIIGRRNALVSVGQEVSVKFLERCNLEAGKAVYSEVGAINSVIRTLGRFQTSSKGIIIGGKIYAQDGIETLNIGTPSSPKTEIICGINYLVQRKLEWIRDKNLTFALQLRETKKLLEHSTKPRPDLVAMAEKLLQGIHKLNEAARVLVNQLTVKEDARIVAYGSVVPGTYIEICNVSYIVTRPLKAVTFFLNKEMGRIEVAPAQRRAGPGKP